MFDNINDIVGLIANWLELIGFLITLFTVWKVYIINKEVKKINNKHLYQTRINDHLEDLKVVSGKIATLLNNPEGNTKELRIEMLKCLEYCKSISKKVSKNDFSNLKPFINKLNGIVGNEGFFSKPMFKKKLNITESSVDSVYESLTALITEIENFNIDLSKTLK